MKNIKYDDTKSLTKDNVLEFFYSFEMKNVSCQWIFLSFVVEDIFKFSVYLPPNIPAAKIDSLKVHLYEIMGHPKTSWSLLHPKTDKRFINEYWVDFFQKDPRSAAILSPKDLVDMVKFTARLSRIKVFE